MLQPLLDGRICVICLTDVDFEQAILLSSIDALFRDFVV